MSTRLLLGVSCCAALLLGAWLPAALAQGPSDLPTALPPIYRPAPPQRGPGAGEVRPPSLPVEAGVVDLTPVPRLIRAAQGGRGTLLAESGLAELGLVEAGLARAGLWQVQLLSSALSRDLRSARLTFRFRALGGSPPTLPQVHAQVWGELGSRLPTRWETPEPGGTVALTVFLPSEGQGAREIRGGERPSRLILYTGRSGLVLQLSF